MSLDKSLQIHAETEKLFWTLNNTILSFPILLFPVLNFKDSPDLGLSTSCSNFLKKLLQSCSKTLKVAQKLPQNPKVAQKLLSIF